jgi:hypothetical protein
LINNELTAPSKPSPPAGKSCFCLFDLAPKARRQEQVRRVPGFDRQRANGAIKTFFTSRKSWFCLFDLAPRRGVMSRVWRDPGFDQQRANGSILPHQQEKIGSVYLI